LPALEILARDPATRARAGLLSTAHGTVRTPAFVPLATKATVKGLLPHEVSDLGYDMVLGNTFHLFLDPGDERIAGFGGLHEFMGWRRPVITDSGGFQVFSMGHGTVADEIKGKSPQGSDRLGKVIAIEERGVRFRSYLDGSEKFIGPETSMEIQARLNSDIALVFDECTPFHVDRDYTERSTERTHRWLERCLAWHAEHGSRDQLVYGISQGGVYEDLRKQSTAIIAASGTPGIAIGGSLGADKAQMYEVVDWATSVLGGEHEAKPRHLLGIGEIDDLVRGVELGVERSTARCPRAWAATGSRSWPIPRSAGAWTSARDASRTTTRRSWRAAPARPARSASPAATCAISPTPASSPGCAC